MCNLSVGVRAEGKAEGIAAGRLELLNEMVRDGDISKQQAAKRANLTEEEFDKQYYEYALK